MNHLNILKILAPLLAILLSLGGQALAAESGTALKNDTLRREPYADAAATGTLARGAKVDILEKKGAWLKVKASKASGWVRLLSVRRGAAGSSNEAAGVLGLASGRSGTGQVVSTTGVRGLSEEELKHAKFNEDEIKRLEAASIDAAQAQQFAASGKLQARKVATLKKPQATPGEAQ